MAREPETLPGLHVVQIRYQGSDPALPGSDPVDAYAASGAYQLLGAATVVEPEFPGRAAGRGADGSTSV